jgi:hypothetical protein
MYILDNFRPFPRYRGDFHSTELNIEDATENVKTLRNFSPIFVLFDNTIFSPTENVVTVP